MTLTEAKDALASLEASMSRGVNSADRAGRRIQYHGLEEMMAAAANLRRDIAHAQGKPSVRYAVWSGTK